MNDHDYKTHTFQQSKQLPITPLPDNTNQNISLPQHTTTDVTHDQIHDHSTNTTLNSTSHVDNKIALTIVDIIPYIYNIIPWIFNIAQSTFISLFNTIKRRNLK